MRHRVHVFSADGHAARSIERHLRYGLPSDCTVESFAFDELEPAMLRFDAAVADAFEFRGDGLASSGVDLFERFPGRVVLITTLWTADPPSEWPTCVVLPLRQPRLLVAAVHRALDSPAANVPTPVELQRYLPMPPRLQHRERGTPGR